MKKPMKNRVLSLLMAVLLLTQSLCLTAFAAEGETTVIIPSGTSASDVNKILTQALLDSDDVQSWEYYCEGKTKIGTWGNESWGSIEGFTTETGKLIKTQYEHPALADNSDGNYQVRIEGESDEYTIRKLAEPEKADAPISLHDGAAALNAAGGLKAAIFTAVVDDGGLNLTADDVTIQYEGKGALGIGTKWYDVSEITETGDYTVKVIWNGNEAYNGFEGTASVEITSGKEIGSVTLADGASAALVYNDDGSLNVDGTTAAVFTAAVASITPDLTAADVTIEYYATANSGSVGSMGKAWMPLGGGKKDLLTYPAISDGAHQVRISWSGNDAYEGFSAETAVTMTARSEAPYTLNNPIGSVKLAYGEDMAVDYAALYGNVFNAVVASSEVLTAENVTIEYYATANSGSVGSVGKAWMPLDGGKKDLLTYPAISAGEQRVRISWPGSSQYAPTAIEATVTVADRDALTFQLKEGPYTVGIVFTGEQGFDYEATAKAIYDAAVESTAPIQVDYADITVEYDASLTGITTSYKPLNNSDTLTKKFGEGTWSIRFSWAGNREYAPGSAVVSVDVTDSRLASAVALKEGVSFTYNKDVAVMKQAILDSVIDWETSTLPAKETLRVDDFTFTYNAKLSLLDGATGDVADSIVDKVLNGNVQTAYVPFEGKSYDILNQTLGSYPQIGAGEQQIKVAYNGGAEYKPSAEAEGTVQIEKASVKVSVKSASMYVSEAKDGLNLVTTDPADDFDLFVLYAGINSNVTTGIYLELPARYTSNSTIMKVVDGILSGLGRPTLTQMLQNGITVGELRELLNATEVIEALEKLGVDTGSFGQIITVVNKLPSIGNSLRIGFGVPNKAGIYTVTAITNNANYKTGVGVGALVLKADKATLVWNQDIGKKISAADAKNADFGASLQVNGERVEDQSSVHVLYSGFTSKWKVYSSTTTPPTEAGRYTMTVVVLGGNYVAAPITRSFQITK